MTSKNNSTVAGLGLALVFVLFGQFALAQGVSTNVLDFNEVSSDTLGTMSEGLGVAAGGSAPDATLVSVEGEEITLSELWAEQNLLLIFYRGGWCPFCNAQTRDMTLKYSQFQDRSVLPVMISVDKPDGAAIMTAAYEVPFPIMSDSDLDAHQAYNVVLEISDTQYQNMLSRGTDLEAYSGQTHHRIAVPSSFLIAQGGQLVWSHVDTDHRTRPSSDQLLQVIDDNL